MIQGVEFMRYSSIFFGLVLILAISFSPLAAMEAPLMGADEEWLPAVGKEYMALNFGLFLTAETQEELMSGQPELSNLYDEERFSLDYRTSLFSLFIDGSLVNDGKYSDQEPYMGGRYIYLNDAFIKTESDLFSIKAGRGPHHDVVDSPYSLFVSSADIPVLYGEINYTGEFFFYKTRWVNMSYNSAQIYYGTEGLIDPTGGSAVLGETYWLDKGMNFKVYGINVGDWRFGFEDVVVYLNRPFDAEYFLNPLPMYFVQLFTTELGVPWAQSGNTGSLIGLFADLNRGDWGGDAQVLIDDLNLDILPWVPDRSFKSKVAWSLGGWKDFDFGTMGFHHAGATKYTFASTRTIESSTDWGTKGYVDVPYSILPYDYAYYPVTEYDLKSGEQMPVYYEDMYAGYKYGENNLAFLVDYETTLFSGRPEEFKLYTYLEYVMNGSKSPSNPWHEYDSTRNPDIEASDWVLFTGEPIEHILRVKANVRKKIGNFTLMTEILAGYVFNGIKLVSVLPSYEDYASVTWEEPKIYVPQNGNNFPIFQCSVGFNYSFQIY
jgi:hypothetical protein